ncbi:BppU family phage baseplate upper protein [Enterococcus faecium]|uniref:BppU family phage baseplate upper protein n=1 Tax=Enterococcus faecium TaxID=1352 RepID=UPI0030C7BDBB
MASSLYNLALDFSKELNYTKAIMARQGDKGITVTVKPFLNGLQMDTSGGTFTLKGTTPSNRYVDNVATSVTSEEVTFSLDGTFMSEAGYYKHCYVEYRKDNQILTTQDIIFFSLGVSDISQGQADEYVSQLEELIRKYNETFDAFMAEIKGRVDSLNQQITDLTGQAKTLQDKLDALKEEISKLGNLQVMYSNSIDFGGYDYSGKPNLMSKLKSSDFNVGYHGSLTLDNEKLHFTSDGTGSIIMFTRINTPQLTSGKTYTLSAKVRFDEGTTGAIDKLRLVYRTSPGEKILLEANSTNITTDDVGKEITIKGTANVNYQITNLDRFYMSISFVDRDKINGGFKLYDIKIEEGSTATPYQPNLLDDPYWLGKAPLGENIANKSVTFPIKSSAYSLYQANMEEEFVLGQTYTITMKATKPPIQTFIVYNEDSGDYRYGNLEPVEGLVDTWGLTFTPQKVGVNYPKRLTIIQYPQSTTGACQIDWLKIEKGDTRTPNISQFKYFGEGLKDSNNPNDYSWDVTPEYTEKGLNDAVNVYDPQRVEGLKNFADGIQIAGDKVISENDCTVYTLTKDNSQSFIDGYATFIKHGKEVIVNGTVKFKKAYAFGVPLDDEVPDEFVAKIVHGMLTGPSGTSSVSKAMYVRKDLGTIITNSEFAANEWFTFHGNYWVGEE